MRRSLTSLALAVPLLLSAVARGETRPTLDAYHAAAAAQPLGASPVVKAPAAIVASRDAQRGVPTFLFAAKDRAPGALHALSAKSPEDAARAHLEAHASRYGLTAPALATAKVARVHALRGGGHLVVFRQEVGGVELIRSDLKVLLDRDRDLVAIGGNLHAAAGGAPRTGFLFSEEEAIAAAFADLYAVALGPSDLVDTALRKASYRHFVLGPSTAAGKAGIRLLEPFRAKKVYFPLPDRIVPAYYLEIQARRPGARNDVFAYVIAADDGRLLRREDLTHADTFNYRVFADPTGDHRPADGPLLDYTPYPAAAPDGSYPGFRSPVLISTDGFNKAPGGGSDPWLPSGATDTLGNNVSAYTDDDAPDGYSANDIRATATSPGTFDRTYDVTLGPQSSDEQRMASITQLFYTTNWLHDWWYDSGFDEASGNAQADNYGRGGVAGDPLRAEGQDGAPQTRDNSDMSVPADGASPRMQMYVWDGKSSRSLELSAGGVVASGAASFGPGAFDVTADLVLADDGTAPVTDVCQGITNDVAGKIVVADRGTCSFQSKAVAAQSAGALGLIIINNQPSATPNGLPGDPQVASVTIPTVSMTMTDGAALKTALGVGTVTAHLTGATDPDRDGTIDNTVIAHEWGHYLHLRQVACGSPACAAESEGWADFTALQMVVRAGDDLHGAYPLAQYATAAFPDDAAYFGIRRFPYSVDFDKNPLTFKHISSGQALPTNAPMSAYNAAGDNAEAHAAGEVWASMLFEGFVALLERSTATPAAYTFDEARRRMSDYVVAGLELAPTDPTYTEQRDGILAAAAAADMDDFDTLAKAYARRGLGSCAVSPARDSVDLSGVVESFVVSPNPIIAQVTLDDSTRSCDMDGVLDAGESGNVTVTVMNGGTTTLSGGMVTVTSKSADLVLGSDAPLALADIPALGTATVKVPAQLLASAKGKEKVTLSVDVTPSGCLGGAVDEVELVDYDELAAASATDDVESATLSWTRMGGNANAIWARVEASPGDHAYRAVDFASPSDTNLESPELDVGADDFIVSFSHRYQFEQSMGVNWDGGVVEIEEAGGTYADLSKYADPGYGGAIGDTGNQAQNPIGGRNGYVGQNASWPARDQVSVNLGKAFAGKKVHLRFRVGTDQAEGAFGWEIDDIGFQGITNLPFHAFLDDHCGGGGAGGGGGGGGAGGGSGGSSSSHAASSGSGGKEMTAEGGCGCRTSGGGEGSAGWYGVVLLAGLVARRRSRR